MSDDSSAKAVAALKAKLEAFTKNAQKASQSASKMGDALIPLAGINFTPGPSIKKWDPKDHPRDPNTGEFIKGLSGYIFGKAQKAEFTGTKSKIKVDLKPGDALYQTPAGNGVVIHADDSITVYSKTTGQAKNAISTGTAWLGTESGKASKKVAEAEAVEVEAENLDEAKDKLAHPQHYETDASALPIGTKVKGKSSDGSSFTYEKTQNGFWTPEDGKYAPLGDGIMSDALKAPSKDSGYVASIPEPKQEVPAGFWDHPEDSGSAWDIEKPSLKPGKKTFTAKQYSDFQSATDGKVIVIDVDNQPILSGSWVDIDGKPYKVHVSPHEGFGITAYRWVSTKQQASNLEKEDLITLADLKGKAKSIPDPTGKPYNGPDSDSEAPSAPEQPADVAKALKHGSLMSQAVTGPIPNTATAHKNHALKSVGTSLYINDPTGKTIFGGDWIEVEGKPYQIFGSPNEGHVALAKWVSTKKQASNNTYDFPANLIHANYVKIPDPTGKPYVKIEDKPETVEALVAKYKGWVKNNPNFDTHTLKVIADLGSPDSKIAAKTVLDQIANDEILESPKPEEDLYTQFVNSTLSKKALLDIATDSIGSSPDKQEEAIHAANLAYASGDITGSDMDEAGLWTDTFYGSLPYTPVDEEQTKFMPEGTMLKFTNTNTGAVVNVIKTDGVWESVAGNILSPSVMAYYFAEHQMDKVAYPAGHVEITNVMNDPANMKVDKVSHFAGGEFHLKGGKWYNSDDTDHDVDAALIEAYEEQIEQYIEDIDALEYGGTVTTAHKENGTTLTYTKVEGSDKGAHFKKSTTGALITQNAIKSALKGKAAHKFDITIEPPKKDPYEGLADWEKEILEAVEAEKKEVPPPGEQQFVHPVSGEVFALKVGDIVHKHKSTDNAFIIERPGADLPIFFFNQFGKLYKPKASQKNLATGYEVVSEWPGKQDLAVVGATEDQKPITGAKATDAIATAKIGDQFHPFDGSGPWEKMETHWVDSNNPNAPISHDIMLQSVPSVPGEFVPKGQSKKANTFPAVDEQIVESIKKMPPGSSFYESTTINVWTYTKQEDGSFLASGSKNPDATPTSYTHDHIVSSFDGSIGSKTIYFEFENQDGSPWGAPEAAPEPEDKQTKPVKKKAAAKKDAKPKEYTFAATNKKITLKPNQWLGEYETSNGTYIVHYTAPTSKHTEKFDFYNAETGSQVYMWALSKKAPTKMKKELTALHAEFPVKAKSVVPEGYEVSDAAMDVPNPDSYLWGSWSSNVFSDSVFGGKIKTGYNGTISYYSNFEQFKDENYPNGKNWFSLSNEEKLTLIAAYKDDAGQIYTDVNAATFDSKSAKTTLTKTKNAAGLVYRIALLAEQYLDGDGSYTDEDFEAELAEIGKKAASPTTALGGNVNYLVNNYPLSDIYSVLKDAEAQRQFKKTLSALDFDPYDPNVSSEALENYAKAQGVHHLSVLGDEDKKTWVKGMLGDPSVSPSLMNSLNSKIASGKSKAQIAALAASFNDPKANDSTKFVSKGVISKKTLLTNYSWKAPEAETGIEITYLSDDTWNLKNGEVTITANDALVSILVNSAVEQGYSIQSSDTYAYQNLSVVEGLKSFEKEHGVNFKTLGSGVWTEEVNAKFDAGLAAKDAPAKFVNSASQWSKVRWLVASLAGDEIAKYEIEKSVGILPPKDTHPGSPHSVAGAAAYTALNQYILQHHPEYWESNGKKSKVAESLVVETYGPYNEFSEVFGGYGAGYPDAWLQFHPGVATDVPTVYSAVEGKTVVNKPMSITDQAWTITGSVEKPEDLSSIFADDDPVWDLTESEIDAVLSNSYAQGAGLYSVYTTNMPKALKMLGVWASREDNYENSGEELLKALAFRGKAGQWLEQDTPVWLAPNGAKFPISPGAQVHQNGGYYYITGPANSAGKITSAYIYNSNGDISQANNYTVNSINNGETNLIFAMGQTVSYEESKKDIPDASWNDITWKQIEGVEKGQGTYGLSSNTGGTLISEIKNSDLDEYPNIAKMWPTFPLQIQQAVATFLNPSTYGMGKSNSDNMLSVIEYKAGKGHYASMQTEGLYNANQPWLPYLSKGQTAESDVMNSWDMDAINGYVKFFGLSSPDQIPEDLSRRLHPEDYYAISKVDPPLPSFDKLSLQWSKSKSKGMHSGEIWVDQDGNEWMSKAFPSDPNAKMRVDAETAANKIATLYGFEAPTVYTANVYDKSNGNSHAQQHKHAYLQHMKPAKYDFGSVSYNDLSNDQLGQAMSEHIVDWITANHDTHSQNLMLGTNNRVFGIDKGQAFKHFPNDKLAVGYLPPENGAPVWYDQFYNALRSGQISKDKADEITKQVLRAAQRVSKDKDDDYRALLEEAFQNRNTWPSEYPSKEQMIDALVERKHATFDSFVDFYKSLYADSPYEFDIDTDNLVPPSINKDTWLAATSDFADQVKASGLHGKTLFFKSNDLEDSHVLMSTAKDNKGNTILTGEAKIRKDGDVVLSNWLAKQTVENKAGYIPEPEHNPAPYVHFTNSNGNYHNQPWSAEWFNALVGGSKTVSSHNASGDQQYNAGTLSNMEASKIQFEAAYVEVDQWLMNNKGVKSYDPFVWTDPNGTEHTFLTLEQVEAWRNMIETYNGYYKQVIAAKGTTEKVKPHFTQPQYQPSQNALDQIAEAKKAAAVAGGKPEKPADVPVGDEISYGGNVFKKTGPVVWTHEDSGGTYNESVWAAGWDSPEIKYLGTPEPVEEEEEADPDEISNSVKIGTKVLKVTYRKSASKNGQIDFDSGDLTLSGGETTNFNTGHMYEIDFGNTVITYRPWGNNHGVALAQQGLLRFEKKNWDGDSESISEIFDVLRQMGLELDPADEQSLELFYWTHLTAILKQRKGGQNGKWGKITADVMAALAKDPNMSDADRLAVYRAAWTEAIGAEKVENADWMPKFSRLRPHKVTHKDEEFTAGHPYWHRPDYNLEDVKAIIGSKFPASALSDYSDSMKIAMSGGSLSTEERARFYGSVANSGASSETDQTNGSSAVVYMRQNIGFGESSYQIVYHPRVLLRTHNYAYNFDGWGKLSKQVESAPWDHNEHLKHGGGGEVMIKNATSVIDDIVLIRFQDATQRNKAIKFYKDQGITHLHGMPIEEVFVMGGYGSNVNGTEHANKVWNDALSAAKGGNS